MGRGKRQMEGGSRDNREGKLEEGGRGAGFVERGSGKREVVGGIL
jgi:hypothetical protein